jgi:sec-independent protein translocase protein TatC
LGFPDGRTCLEPVVCTAVGVVMRSRFGIKKVPSLATPSDTMSLTDHLRELRQRLVKTILAIVVGMMVMLAAFDPVVRFLKRPYDQLCLIPKYHCSLTSTGTDGASFILTDPLAGLGARMRVAGWGGLVLALPVILWQIWKFVVPALHKKEKQYALPFVLSSLILFAMGASIAYLTLEKALEFLVGWAGPGSAANFTIDKYLRLVTLMMLAFGIGFLFPVLLVFLQIVKVMTPKQLLVWWRQAIVVIVIVAAVITPSGDPISLFALAVPMWIFYFMAIGIGHLIVRKSKSKEPATPAA